MRYSSSSIFSAIAYFALLCVVRADDDEYVSCGSFIKIQHRDTGYFLNSEEKSFGGTGSGQQIVTWVKKSSAATNSRNTLWWVRPANHNEKGEYPDSASCKLAEPIKCGDEIRLTHQDTMRNLHSHAVASPLTNQQEVSGYGTGDGKGDGGDNWKVDCGSSSSTKGYWKRGTTVRLKHVDTGKYLGASAKAQYTQSNCGHGCPIMNHLESFARSQSDSASLVKVEEGIHLSM